MLPERARRQLVDALVESICSETNDDVDHAWVAEARRRAGKLERGEVESRDGERVVAEIEARLQNLGAA